MKLKNCEVGDIVKLKKGVTKEDLSACDGDGGYFNWHSGAKAVCDELLSGGEVEVIGTVSGCVDLKHNDWHVFLLPKFVKLVVKPVKEEDTQNDKKELVVGDKVVLKPNLILDDLYWTDSFGTKREYKSYHYSEQTEMLEVADKLLDGGIATIKFIDEVDVKVEIDVGCYRDESWWLDKSLVSLYATQGGECEADVMVEDNQKEIKTIEIKPFMLVEVLDASFTSGLAEVGEVLVVKEVSSVFIKCLRSDGNLDSLGIDRVGCGLVTFTPEKLKVINSNIGD